MSTPRCGGAGFSVWARALVALIAAQAIACASDSARAVKASLDGPGDGSSSRGEVDGPWSEPTAEVADGSPPMDWPASGGPDGPVGIVDPRGDAEARSVDAPEPSADGAMDPQSDPASTLSDAGLEGGACVAWALALCDDGNPCTLDRQGDGCTCLHDVLADGTACDDGDPCSEAERCSAGLCLGHPVAATAALLGSLRGLSDSPGLGTAVALASERRAVFATGNRLTLLGLDGDRLSILDRRESAIVVGAGQISPQIWVQRPRFFLVPLGNERVAVVGHLQGIDLYDVSGPSFAPLGRYGFPGSVPVQGAAGRGNRIWICSSNGLQLFTIDESGNLAQGPSFNLPANHACQGMALSADGRTLLVATWSGLDRVDVTSADGSMALTKSVLDGHFLLDVAANAQYAAVYDLQDKQSGLGDVLVLPANGDAALATFPMQPTARTPVGFAMLDAGLVLERSDPGTWSNLVAELYQLSPAGASLSRSTAIVAAGDISSGPPLPVTAAGTLVAVEPYHQILRLADSGDFVTVTGPEQGSFETVRPAGASTVESHGPRSTALLDLSDAAAPTFKKGGMGIPVGRAWPALELSGTGRPAPLLLPVSTRTGNLNAQSLQLLWSAPDDLASASGAITAVSGTSRWATAGEYVVELVDTAKESYRVRRLRASSLLDLDGRPPSPELDQVVSALAATADERVGTWFDMDAVSGRLAILEQRRRQGADAASADFTYLGVYALSASGYRLAFSRPASPEQPVGVGVAGDRVVWATARSLTVFGPDGEVVASLVSDAGPVADRLLRLDGKHVYVVTGARVRVLQTTDLTELASYATPEPVTSMAVTGRHLVFGMPGGVAIASPACASVGGEP